ncbi:hypothetical protein [Clostridium felsineum]|uniref:hypothetical protein n=1 Tax=Clostridium felsineum TaxID=36839 RepID=UPI00214DB5E9|nr:hypothetical protein [Clostridium felsineum]
MLIVSKNIKGGLVKFEVIVAKHNDKWVFVKIDNGIYMKFQVVIEKKMKKL